MERNCNFWVTFGKKWKVMVIYGHFWTPKNAYFAYLIAKSLHISKVITINKRRKKHAIPNQNCVLTKIAGTSYEELEIQYSSILALTYIKIALMFVDVVGIIKSFISITLCLKKT